MKINNKYSSLINHLKIHFTLLVLKREWEVNMKIYFNLIYNLIFVILILIAPKIFSQDTFSIVAVDTITGEIGSAGASCINMVLM